MREWIKKSKQTICSIKQKFAKRESRLLKQINRSIHENLLSIMQTPPKDTLELREHIDTFLSKELQRTLIKRLRKKEKFKTFFFVLTMVLLILVVIGAGVFIWSLRKEPEENKAALITAAGGLVATLLGLPTIIANYLFNKDEDETIAKQLLNMRDNDLKWRMDKNKEARKDAKEMEMNVEEIEAALSLI